MRKTTFTLATTGLVLGGHVLFAGVASAHVTVNAPGATQGGYTTITLKVPTESDTASTTEIRVQLPADHPIASVSIQPKPGWSYTVTKGKPSTSVTAHGEELTEVVTGITWKADSAATAIEPGEFDQFVISA